MLVVVSPRFQDRLSGEVPVELSVKVTANGSTPGLFEVTQKNGTKGQSRLNADGTYTDMDAKGKVTAKGTWDVTGGKTCFHPEGKAADCYTETAPGPDGSFTATSDKGETVTVKKIS